MVRKAFFLSPNFNNLVSEFELLRQLCVNFKTTRPMKFNKKKFAESMPN